jgi:hypothetical protein
VCSFAPAFYELCEPAYLELMEILPLTFWYSSGSPNALAVQLVLRVIRAAGYDSRHAATIHARKS